jgi:hypothetical protein
VEYAINSDVTLDASVLAKYKLSAPSAVALVMAGLRLSPAERTIQSHFEHLRYFPSFPLASDDEIKIATCGGVRIRADRVHSSPTEVELRNTVATKFDKMRIGAKRDGNQPPGVDSFWELLTKVHDILENSKLRSISSSGPNKR